MFEASELKLNLVTAISSSDQEEIVASLLYSQGCNIIYRAITPALLTEFINKTEIATSVLYSKDFGSEFEINNLINTFKQHRFILIEKKFDPAQLLHELAKISRPPLFHVLPKNENLATVMGSPSSPGISTLSNHIALHLKATLIVSTHHNLRPSSGNKFIQISATHLGEKIEELSSSKLIIDGGNTVSLTSTLADRRVNAQWLSQSLNCSKSIIYVTKSDENGILYLKDFIEDYSNLVNPPNLICVLNQQKFDRYGQVVQKQFLELTKSCLAVQMPYDLRTIRAATFPSKKYYLWRTTAFSKQIAKIGEYLK